MRLKLLLLLLSRLESSGWWGLRLELVDGALLLRRQRQAWLGGVRRRLRRCGCRGSHSRCARGSLCGGRAARIRRGTSGQRLPAAGRRGRRQRGQGELLQAICVAGRLRWQAREVRPGQALCGGAARSRDWEKVRSRVIFRLQNLWISCH